MSCAVPSYVLRRPLIGVSAAVAGGMALSASGRFSFPQLIVAAVGCLLFTICFIRRRRSGWRVLGCVALVSACRFMAAALPLSQADVIRLEPYFPLERTAMVGRVLEPPHYRAGRTEHVGTLVFPLACEGVEVDGEWRRYRGHVRVRIARVRSIGPLRHGQRIRLRGTLRKRLLPGGQAVELNVRTLDDLEILHSAPLFSPSIWGQRLRGHGARILGNGLEYDGAMQPQLAIYRALLLGYRDAIPQEVYQHFKRTGTLHIFAISGLHVGMVGLFVTVLLKGLGISRERWGLWLLPLLLVYVLVTGMKSSALRAFTMTAVYFMAPLFRRKPDVPVSIAFALIVLLYIRPLELLSPGFIYSFTVVGFIVLFFSAVPDGFLFRGAGWTRSVRTYVLSLVLTSVAAFVASAPLTAFFFGTFTPISLVGNLIVVPLTFCIVLCGWLSMLLPFASVLFNHAALIFINGLLGTVNLLSDLPVACMDVDFPSLVTLIFWYGGWIHLFTHARRGRPCAASFMLVGSGLLLMMLTSRG